MITNKQILLEQLKAEDWQGDVPILISPEAKQALLDFLYDEDCMEESYSQFILKAISLRRQIEQKKEV